MKQKMIPLPKAIIAILLSVCLIIGPCLAIMLVYGHIREKQRMDPTYQIVAVVQTTSDTEGLKTAYLTEILDLSVDRPVNLYHFNAKEAQKTLQAFPVIKEASVRKILPGTLHVDYTMRKPIAYYKDYQNTAIDAEGVLFPFKPFFTPKRLPDIITGVEIGPEVWGTKVESKWMALANALVGLSSTYCDEKSVLCAVDVSHAYADVEGQREIVLSIEDRVMRMSEGKSVHCIYPRILRLCPDNYRQQLANYISLRNYLREKERAQALADHDRVFKAQPTIIDLRLTDLGYVQ